MNEYEKRKPITSWKEWGTLLQYEHERLLEDYKKKNEEISVLTNKYDKLLERVEKLEQFKAVVYAIAALIILIGGMIEFDVIKFFTGK